MIIATPTRPEAYTTMLFITFGSSCVRRTRSRLAPVSRAASMYSCTATRRVAASATRATGGMNTIVTAIIAFSRPGPRDAPIAIASRIAGKAYSMSSTRMMAVPTRPPESPAQAPSSVPITVAATVGPRPASSESLPP
jgi:hypothetical protein